MPKATWIIGLHWCASLTRRGSARFTPSAPRSCGRTPSRPASIRDSAFSDGAQAGTLLFELTDDLLRERLAQRDEPTLALVTRFSLDRLRGMVAQLLADRQEIDWPAWRAETPEGLTGRWEEFWRNDIVPRVLRRIAESDAAKTVHDVAMRWPPATPKMRERCDFLIEELPKLREGFHAGAKGAVSPREQLAAIRESAKVQGGATKNTWGNAAAFEQFRDAAKTLRDAIDNVDMHMQFDAAAARPAAETALHVLRLAADLADQYDAKKRELAVLDFNDLLIHARRLLAGSEHDALRRRLAAQIRLLLVDEFQDTDPLQVDLIKSLCDNEHLRGKLFFVGDHKQSIYRFRGADPHVFRQLREEIPVNGQLPLSLNFRSQPAVLDFVNALFCEELGPNYEPLRAHRRQLAPTPAIEFLWASDAAVGPAPEGEQTGQPPDAAARDDMSLRERLRRREADWIARRIRAMLDAGEKIVYEEGEGNAPPVLRPVRPGDVALLFRAMTNVEYYEESLRRYGIDYYLVGGHAFYAQQEIYDLLNLLRAINSPSDEVSLAGVLRSPMFGLLDESLLWLAEDRGLAAGLFAGDFSETLDGDQRRRAECAAATLRELRAMKDRMPLPLLIREALDRTGYDALLLAEFLGERKLANLGKLIEQARSFDRAGIFGLSDFITQLSEFVARQPDEPLAATNPESTDVVRLMSIHQSKGLEFPVVVVPDMARPRRVMGPSAAFTPRLGPMFKDVNATTGYDLFMMAESDEDLEETKRLLYVATTRAADYLILAAGVESLGEPVGPWMELIARRFDLTNGQRRPTQNAEGIVISTHEPLVAVTVTEPAIRSKPLDLRVRRDLVKIVEKAREMAGKGQGRRPRYVAAIPRDAGARRQHSFSRISGALTPRPADSDFSPLNDDVSAAGPLDARGLGTLVHAVLAEVDFAAPGDVGELVRRHAEEQSLDSPRLQSVAADVVAKFLESPRAAAMASAREMHRELEFLLAWPFDGGSAAQGVSAEPHYLQGFIDCLYCDAEGRWRLVDYKTSGAHAERYELQLFVYAMAVERILRQSPDELVLCFLRSGQEHRAAWNDAARRRAMELVGHALPLDQ